MTQESNPVNYLNALEKIEKRKDLELQKMASLEKKISEEIERQFNKQMKERFKGEENA